MGLWDKLRQASDYLRKKRLSLGPDSYFQYKRERKRERKHAREHAESSAQRERNDADRVQVKANRERGYDKRYAREREGDRPQRPTTPEEHGKHDR